MLKLSDSIRSTETLDGTAVLDIRHGQMFRLNPVGSRILGLLAHGYDETRISEEISRECSVTLEIVEADVRDFILTLEKHRFLEHRGSAGQV